MALLQNITRNAQYPYRISGATGTNTETGKMLSQIGPGMGREFMRFFGLPTKDALPSGYNPGVFMPLVHQEISSWYEAEIRVSTAAEGLRGLPGEASSSFALATTASILPLDDTPMNNVGTASFAVSVGNAEGQLITSGTGASTFSIYTNTPLLIASLDGSGSTGFIISTNTPLLGAEASAVGDISFSVSSTAEALPLDDSPRNNIASALFSFSGSIEPYATGALSGEAFLAGGAIDEFAILGRMEYDNAVHIHVTNGQPGTKDPIGTRGVPVNNLTDALTIARGLNLRDIVFLSDYTIASGDDVTKYRLRSDDWKVITIESGATTTDTEFQTLSVYGELSGTWNVFHDCWVYDVTNFLGWMRGGSLERVELAPYIVPDPFSLGSSYFDNVVPMYANIKSVMVMATAASVSLTGCSDMIEIQSMAAGNVINAALAGGKIIVDASCLGGDIHVSGTGTVENNSLLDIHDAGLNNEDSAWGASASANNVAGTTGNKLNTASSGGVDLTALADAVWSAAEAEFISDGTEFLLKTLTNKRGIIQEASGWFLIVYDDDGTTPILRKALKDVSGGAIAAIASGALAIEEASSV